MGCVEGRCTGACCRAFVLSVTHVELKRSVEAQIAGESTFVLDSGKRRSLVSDGPKILTMVLPLGVHKVNPYTKFVYEEPRELFDCRHQKENGDCGAYEQRPRLCRNYPYGKACPNPWCRWEAVRGWNSAEGIYASQVSA